MPQYELGVVVRHGLSRAQLVDVVKRSGKQVLDHGGFIRKVEFLGERVLPQKQSKWGQLHSKGHYFNLRIDLQSKKTFSLLDELHRDGDLLRRFLALNDNDVEPEPEPPCTLEEELRTPANRPSVQRLIKLGAQAPFYTQLWDPRTGLSFYPFRR